MKMRIQVWLFISIVFLALSHSLKAEDSLVTLLHTKTPGDTSYINLCNQIASHFLATGNEDDTINHYISLARQQSIKTGYKAGEALADYNAAKIELHKNNYPMAIRLISHSKELYESIGDSAGIANCTMQFGVINYSEKNPAGAFPFFEQAYPFFVRHGNLKYSSMVRYLSGLCLNEMGRFTEAESRLREAETVKKQIGDIKGYYECHYGLAEVFYGTGRYDISETYYRECLSYFTKMNNPIGIILAKIGVANQLLATGRKDSVLILLDDAYHASKNSFYIRGLLNSTQSLSQYFVNQGDFHKAFDFQREYYTTRDSVYSNDATRKSAAVERELSLTRKQAEIDLLSKQGQIDRILRIVLIAGLAAIIIFSILLFQRFRFKKVANKKLEATNQELNKTLQDLKTTQRHLIQAEKMAALGQITAGIAHEIRNPVNFINNFSALSIELLEELKTVSEDERKALMEHLRTNLEKIEQNGKRANGIVSSMEMHSRPSSGTMEETNLRPLVENTIGLTFRAIRSKSNAESIRIEKSIEADLPLVKVVPQDISWVLVNLLNNSLTAIQNKIIKNGSDFSPLIEVELHRAGKEVIISVSDNGEGIIPEIRDKIFHPFFSTKASGEGTGLGLSISHDILLAHQGSIELDTKRSDVTRFVVRLPVNS